ncbi:MAG: hypothetical protein K6E86_09545 [Bacteroidales bacterium]|nr:hypothetical protein [Bacteroidales bacterium]
MSVYTKIKVLYEAICGYFDKWSMDCRGHKYLPSLHHNINTTGNVVVSLTSYGRRVSNSVVYYTLVSILRQDRLPDRLILWLDRDHWNDNNIPQKLKVLRDHHGVEIMFCEEIRSYKKLIPTLSLCPDDIVITVDDDIIYHRSLIRTMLERYQDHKGQIVSFQCVKPLVDNKGQIKRYRQWERSEDGSSGLLIFPIGYNAVLYPPYSLHNDVFDKDVFQSICPYADDVWFWLQAVRQGTLHHCIVDKEILNYSFDALYQFMHKGSALMHRNVSEQGNVKQLEACLKYFGMTNDFIKEGSVK